MAMALGMHREGTSGGFDDLEREVRKRIWWTTYLFEQHQCAVLGRPCAIDDTEVNVSFPNELVLDGGQSVPQNYVEHAVRLSKIMSEVRRRIYASSATRLDSRTRLAVQLLLELGSWNHSLPHHLRLEYTSHSPKHRRAVIFLHIQFHMTQVLVSRPFILRKVGVELARKLGKHVRSQDLDEEELKLSHACCTYSEHIIILLLQLLSAGMFDGVAWIDAFYVYHGVFVLALDFLARPWNDEDTPEDRSRKQAVIDIMAAMHNIRLCPTFTILTQVSFQLAKIVGIFDPPPLPNVTQPQPQQLQYIVNQPQQPYTLHTLPLQVPVENAVTSWFQNKPDDMPWDLRDFFGSDGYVGPNDHNVFSMAQNGYPNRLSEEDDLLLNTLPSNLAYTQWGAIGTPFAQNRGGAVQRR
jgi:proline utilization trans-activator